MVRDDVLYEALEVEELPRFLYAGFGARLLAFIIDMLVISALGKILVRPLLIFLNIGRSKLFFSPYNLLYLAVYLLYFLLLTKASNGQTLGKMVLGIRVVSLDREEEKLTWSNLFYREFLGRFILRRIKLLYLMALVTRKKQQLGDIFANSSVVNDEYFFEYQELRARAQESSREEILVDMSRDCPGPDEAGEEEEIEVEAEDPGSWEEDENNKL